MRGIRFVARHACRADKGRWSRGLSSAADHEDEFCYPVNLVSGSSNAFVWDCSDIEGFCDLSPLKFSTDRKIVYSKPDLKILKMVHADHGIVSFSFIKDPDTLWKICNISIIGQESAVSVDSIQATLVDSFNSSPGAFARPYQFGAPPHCWSIYDHISAQVKEHSSGDVFRLSDPVKSILSSQDIVQFCCGVSLVDPSGVEKAEYDAVATVNKSSDSNNTLCSVFLQKK